MPLPLPLVLHIVTIKPGRKPGYGFKLCGAVENPIQARSLMVVGIMHGLIPFIVFYWI